MRARHSNWLLVPGKSRATAPTQRLMSAPLLQPGLSPGCALHQMPPPFCVGCLMLGPARTAFSRTHPNPTLAASPERCCPHAPSCELHAPFCALGSSVSFSSRPHSFPSTFIYCHKVSHPRSLLPEASSQGLRVFFLNSACPAVVHTRQSPHSKVAD